jgi:hypothetical protein
MLDGNDTETFHSIRLFHDSLLNGNKPLVFWVGAGASAWGGFPLWAELAQAMNSRFVRHEHLFNKRYATDLIAAKRYPEFFNACKDSNEQIYHSVLAEMLKARTATPVYQRFIEALKPIKPLSIVTTNVDEALENSLPAITTVQRSDLERCITLLQQKKSFLCKLHGSLSMVRSLVLTSQDYAQLLRDTIYLSLINHIFAEAMVVFIGYGPGDDYVLDLLRKSGQLKQLFGDGPHFAIISGNTTDLPNSISRIRYHPRPHKDHRSAIQIVDEARKVLVNPDFLPLMSVDQKPDTLISGHLISDIWPPGTGPAAGHSSSQVEPASRS